jgi:hypothetical protein
MVSRLCVHGTIFLEGLFYRTDCEHVGAVDDGSFPAISHDVYLTARAPETCRETGPAEKARRCPSSRKEIIVNEKKEEFGKKKNI